MRSKPIDDAWPSAWSIVTVAGVRTAFGVIMAVDAFLKWQPAFASHYFGYLQNAANGQPALFAPWFHFWLRIVGENPRLFIGATRWIETAIAAGLLLGLCRRFTYIVGALFSLLIWSTAEGFGGPYTSGATNLGPALVYALIFVALASFEHTTGRSPYSLDYYIERVFPSWGSWMELAPKPVWQRPVPELSADVHFAAIGGVIFALVLALSTLQSAMTTAPPTPKNAAAAVAPLNLAMNAPVARAVPAALPPLLGEGDTVAVTISSRDADIEIAGGVHYQAWTFGGTVPGPILHVRQGQTVNVTFVNNGNMQHSIDLHAAQVAPDIAYRSINPGEKLTFSFVAFVPGAFIYHCGTPPVLQHIGNGMFGAIIVDPAQPLPPADVSYVLVQSEWYAAQVEGTSVAGDYDKMLHGAPDEVVFNGAAFQYNDHPLPAKVGQRVRLYVINAGPNLSSAFHIIGGVFAAVYPDGDAAHALTGVSTYPISPGQGVVVDAILQQPGKYPFVDHSMRDMAIGAAGQLSVTP